MRLAVTTSLWFLAILTKQAPCPPQVPSNRTFFYIPLFLSRVTCYLPGMSEKKFEILYRETLFQGYFRVDRFHLRQELYAGGWSAPFSREVFHTCKEVVIVLLFDPHHDKVVMIEQFRAGPMARGDDPFGLEFVAGMVEPGETPEATIRRESIEEAGCTVTDLIKIHSYYPSPGSYAEHASVYVGRTVAPEDGSICGLASEGEDIKVVVLDATQALNKLYMGEIRDAGSLIALQWFSLNHTDIRSRWLMSESSTPII